MSPLAYSVWPRPHNPYSELEQYGMIDTWGLIQAYVFHLDSLLNSYCLAPFGLATGFCPSVSFWISWANPFLNGVCSVYPDIAYLTYLLYYFLCECQSMCLPMQILRFVSFSHIVSFRFFSKGLFVRAYFFPLQNILYLFSKLPSMFFPSLFNFSFGPPFSPFNIILSLCGLWASVQKAPLFHVPYNWLPKLVKFDAPIFHIKIWFLNVTVMQTY